MTLSLIQTELLSLGYPSTLASLDHLQSLKEDIEALRCLNALHEKIDHDYLDFNFSPSSEFNSILLVSCSIPNSMIYVDTPNGIKPMILPTVYYQTKEADAFDAAIQHLFNEYGIRYQKAHVPLKLLGARTGLTTYGKNNISYVEGFGSYHKLTAYWTSLSAVNTPWLEITRHELCEGCAICRSNCPYDLIDNGTPVIDAGHCLSFPNEIKGTFPDWVTAESHNALMGCIRCQSLCPINEPYKNNVNQLFTFTEQNVDQLLNVEDYNALSDDLKHKIEKIDFQEDFAVFKRNFIALYNNF